jgi:two-component system, cell cycle sensor histidine kinase PleC
MTMKPTYEELEQRVAKLQAIETKFKQAERIALRARRYAESIVETVREPLIVLDAHLRVVTANRSFFKTFKVTAEETEGKLIYEIGNRQWDIPRLREFLEEVIPKNASFDNFEVEHVFKTIGLKIMLLNARRLHTEQDETQMILLAIEDITERRQTEKALSESETRVRVLNKGILNMLMVVSHDLRSPLVSIEATLKLLLRGIYGQMDNSVKNTVIDLRGRIHRLLGVAEDCLGKVSAVAGEVFFKRKVLDLREDIIDPVLNEFSEEMEKQNIVIDNRLGAIPARQILIKADKVWLKIVFRNLFSNAIKHGGRGCVLAFGCEDCGSHYKLNVYNSGAPIPENLRDKLFTKFHRVEERGELISEGMGLGLYLTKEIIQKHGGDIWYEPKEWGSNFVLTLPHDRF